MLNLFIHVLQRPLDSSVHKDLTLLDIATSHFARLEYASDSQISFEFVKEVAVLARDTVTRAKERANVGPWRDSASLTSQPPEPRAVAAQDAHTEFRDDLDTEWNVRCPFSFCHPLLFLAPFW